MIWKGSRQLLNFSLTYFPMPNHPLTKQKFKERRLEVTGYPVLCRLFLRVGRVGIFQTLKGCTLVQEKLLWKLPEAETTFCLHFLFQHRGTLRNLPHGLQVSNTARCATFLFTPVLEHRILYLLFITSRSLKRASMVIMGKQDNIYNNNGTSQSRLPMLFLFYLLNTTFCQFCFFLKVTMWGKLI